MIYLIIIKKKMLSNVEKKTTRIKKKIFCIISFYTIISRKYKAKFGLNIKNDKMSHNIMQ